MSNPDPSDPRVGETAEQYLSRRIQEQLAEGGDLAAELRAAYDTDHGDQDRELTPEEQFGHQIAASLPAKHDPFNTQQEGRNQS